MQHPTNPVFGIVINNDQHCTVWPAHEKPPQGWHFTAARGSRAAMQACVDQQFVPTTPALPVDLDGHYQGAEWAAAEFGD